MLQGIRQTFKVASCVMVTVAFQGIHTWSALQYLLRNLSYILQHCHIVSRIAVRIYDRC